MTAAIDAIEDTSTPVPIIRLWDNLLVPLQGDLTDRQAATLLDDVLGDIDRRSCRALIVDVSGLWLIDSHLCSVLADLSQSAALMGTRTFVAGLRPEVTLTLLSMGIALEGVETVLSLERALERLGISGPAPEEDENVASALQGAHSHRENQELRDE
jgi:rsbT antagonist protein RsbS